MSAVVLDLEDPYFDGQSLPDALTDYRHVHSTTGVCVKNADGPFCPSSPHGREPGMSSHEGPCSWTGFGVVGLGVSGALSPTRKRADLCAEHGHPGVTYNPFSDQTWCLCGEVVTDGDAFSHAACCGGPLEEALTA